MTKLQCPACSAMIESPEGWQKSAVSTLVHAPVVPGMATQLRCDKCDTVFNHREGMASPGLKALWPAAALLAGLLAMALLIPG